MGQVVLLAIAQAFLLLGYGAVMPILPFYLTIFGGGALEYGLLVATFSLCTFIAAGPMGALSDRIGRKPVILLSLVGSSVALVAFGLANSILLLFITRAAEGLFTAGLYPSSDALVSDLAPPEKRGTALGTLLAGRTTGMIFGPTIGGILAQYLGIRVPFFICAGLAALTFVFSFIIIREPRKHIEGKTIREDTASKVEAQSLWGKLGATLHRYRIVVGVGGTLLAVALVIRFTRIFSIAVAEPMFAVYATDPRTFAFSPLDLGIFFLFFASSNALSQLIFGRLSDSIGHDVLLILSGVVTAVAALTAILSTTALDLFMIGALMGIGGAMALPSSAALAAQASPPKERGLVMGLLGMSGSAARAIAPIIGGYAYAVILAATANPNQAAALPLILCAVISIAGSMAVIPLILRSRKPS